MLSVAYRAVLAMAGLIGGLALLLAGGCALVPVAVLAPTMGVVIALLRKLSLARVRRRLQAVTDIHAEQEIARCRVGIPDVAPSKL
jgi:hypothetical protein